MRIAGTEQKIGKIDFRVGNTRDLITYAGHFGYGVAQKHRGNRYAARSCQLLFPLAKKLLLLIHVQRVIKFDSLS